MRDEQIARALGVTGIAMGMAELLAPGWIGRQLGVGDRKTLLRAFGVREVLSGLGILGVRKPKLGLWSRVAGDLLDVAMLGVGVRGSQRRKAVIGALTSVLAITALDVIFARRLQHAN